ncbi:MAG: zinc metallopeptidase, partial [bacterium]|nr:zinc metallopeptidase [bacterium]
VPLANIGSSVSFLLMFLGAMINAANLVVLGIAAFSLVVIFQLINLPVEFNASTRAKEVLVATGMISESERREVEKVLNAAAMTYVAATITALLTLVYYLFRFGLLGQRSDD